MRLIDADKLVEVLRDSVDEYGEVSGTFGSMLPDVCAMVKEMPTVAPVEHGHWIGAVLCALDVASEDYQRAIQDYCNHGGNAAEWQTDTQYCSDCLTGFNVFDNDFILSADYCPHCGAKMDEMEVDKGVLC